MALYREKRGPTRNTAECARRESKLATFGGTPPQARAACENYATGMRFDSRGRFDRRSWPAGYGWAMTAKERLIRDVLDLDETEAARARIVIDQEPELTERVPLPEGWGQMANGEPMPHVAAALRRSRRGH